MLQFQPGQIYPTRTDDGDSVTFEIVTRRETRRSTFLKVVIRRRSTGACATLDVRPRRTRKPSGEAILLRGFQVVWAVNSAKYILE
jgi:hypothetical protein